MPTPYTVVPDNNGVYRLSPAPTAEGANAIDSSLGALSNIATDLIGDINNANTAIAGKLATGTHTAHVADQDAHGLAAVRVDVSNLNISLGTLLSAIGSKVSTSSFTAHTGDDNAHNLSALRSSVAGHTTTLSGLGTASTHAHTDYDAAGAASAVQGNLSTHAANNDAHGLAAVRASIASIQLTPGPQGNAGVDGQRGSLFLGTYATVASLPSANGTTVRVGDFAYVSGTGELWQLN